jgi:hypothetical protein
MTLQEFFDMLAANPVWILAFFILLPISALLLGWIAKGEEYSSPWDYAYSILIYLACIPGIFAVTLSIYLFVFERRSILQTDIYTQILPVLAMLATILIVRRTVDLDRIPGFDKITGLMLIMFAVFAILWVLDKTHIWVVSYLPFWQGILIFAALLLLIRFGWSKLAKKAG